MWSCERTLFKQNKVWPIFWKTGQTYEFGLISITISRAVAGYQPILSRGRRVKRCWDVDAEMYSLQWRHNGRDGVSNHQPHDCLLSRIFRRKSKKNQSFPSLAFVRGIHRWPVNSPHKWPVTRKMFPLDDLMMFENNRSYRVSSSWFNFLINTSLQQLVMEIKRICRTYVRITTCCLKIRYKDIFLLKIQPTVKQRQITLHAISAISKRPVAAEIMVSKTDHKVKQHFLTTFMLGYFLYPLDIFYPIQPNLTKLLLMDRWSVSRIDGI